MKKEKVKYRLDIPLNVVIWLVVYFLTVVGIYWRCKEEFGILLKENSVMRSAEEYSKDLGIIFLIVILLSFLWWIMAIGPLGIRRKFEENTFGLALGFGIVLLVIVIISRLLNNGIVDEFGNQYSLPYAYCLWSSFILNLFGFPPQNVEMVMLPGKRRWRIIVAAVMLIVTIAILMSRR